MLVLGRSLLFLLGGTALGIGLLLSVYLVGIPIAALGAFLLSRSAGYRVVGSARWRDFVLVRSARDDGGVLGERVVRLLTRARLCCHKAMIVSPRFFENQEREPPNAGV